MHDLYNFTNFPEPVACNDPGPWVICRNAQGHCASIPLVPSAGHSASHYGDMDYVNKSIREGHKRPVTTTNPQGQVTIYGRELTCHARTIEGQTVERWYVQSEENAARVYRGERQIGGDRIYPTRNMAILETLVEIEIDRLNTQSREIQAAKEKAAQEKEAKRKALLTEYTANMSPMRRGKIESCLELLKIYKSKALGKEYSGARFQAIDAMVKDGYKPMIEDDDGKTVHLLECNGYYFTITKTEYNFAIWLASREPQKLQPA